MAESKPGQGSCLCKAVRFKAASVSTQVSACHCRMCRKWGGGPFMVVDTSPKIIFEGTENIKRYDSSAWAERGFCGKCGCHLFYHLKHTDNYQIPAGLFDDQDNFNLSLQVFTDKKPGYYSFADDTECLTEAQVIRKYAP